MTEIDQQFKKAITTLIDEEYQKASNIDIIFTSMDWGYIMGALGNELKEENPLLHAKLQVKAMLYYVDSIGSNQVKNDAIKAIQNLNNLLHDESTEEEE